MSLSAQFREPRTTRLCAPDGCAQISSWFAVRFSIGLTERVCRGY